ncbi:MAG: cyclase family protein [Gammaproteobacteria bacterium]|nr:cyclase family protein [Gammaproteobacteria bacterium]
MTQCLHEHAKFPSRWGADDRQGAANLLTPAHRLRALELVTKGEIFDLGHIIENGAPRMAPNQTPFVMTLSARADNVIRRRREMGATNDAGTTLERIEMTTHVGTHIDALGHATIGEEMFNGHSTRDELDDFGLRELGIENVPPLVTRGVCFDLSRLDGDSMLGRGRPITDRDLEHACEADGITVQEGDVVCIHTGWGAHYMIDNERYVSGEPGIDESAAAWLTSRGVVAIGADNMAIEVIPNPQHPARVLPVHQHCLVECGVYLIENLDLRELATNAVREFCFVLLATKFRGATGSPVRPIAMV